MEFTEEQLKKLDVEKNSPKSKKHSNDKFDEKSIKKLKESNQKKMAHKVIGEELSAVLDLIEKVKSEGGDKVLIVSLDYVGERKENCISVESNLFYYYQYLFYDSYQMRPIFNGEGLMVILKNKRDFNKKKNGETK